MNYQIENLKDDSILIHFDLWNSQTKTIRIDALERTRCEVWSRVILLRPSTSSGLRRTGGIFPPHGFLEHRQEAGI